MALDQGSFSVFSTYVEMILCFLKWQTWQHRVLHVCGDDPTALKIEVIDPRVFSTYVEMIL